MKGTALAGAAALLGGLAVALVVGGGGASSKDAPETAKTTASAEPPASAPSGSEPADPDPLCAAHEERAATVAAIGTIDDAAEFQQHMTAQVTFYHAAAALEPESDAAVFRSMATYYDASAAFYGARGWNRDVPIDDLGQVPQPPTDGSFARAAEILSERCGIEPTTE